MFSGQKQGSDEKFLSSAGTGELIKHLGFGREKQIFRCPLDFAEGQRLRSVQDGSLFILLQALDLNRQSRLEMWIRRNFKVSFGLNNCIPGTTVVCIC